MQNIQLTVFPDLSEHPIYRAKCGAMALHFDMDYRIFSLIDFGFRMPPKYKRLVNPEKYEGSIWLSDTVQLKEDGEGNELSYLTPLDFNDIKMWLQNNNIDISETNRSLLRFCADLPISTKIVLWWDQQNLSEENVLLIELE